MNSFFKEKLTLDSVVYLHVVLLRASIVQYREPALRKY